MEQIELKDVQGLIIRGYSGLRSAYFVLAKITDAGRFKIWLGHHVHEFTPGDIRPKSTAINIAFTFSGLKVMGLNQGNLGTFPLEFADGMTAPYKQAMLGDFGNSDPANWEWGQKADDNTHILLMLYAVDADSLNSLYTGLKEQMDTNGFTEWRLMDTTELIKRKEHFGFHDGIAQPTIKGLNRSDDDSNCVAAGEFILGYKNEYEQDNYSPMVDAGMDKANVLPASTQAPGMKDLGKNGTYLVFRQLEQDVEGFWKYMESKTLAPDGNCDTQQMIGLASKVVGRWPSGTPVVLAPEKDIPELDDKNKFEYRNSDSDGLKCPFAAHIRRTNPRDSIDTAKSTSIQIVKRHRVLRRGRSYGPPVATSMEPMDIINASDKSGKRGLHFICINTNLALQFEFIQNFWVNNPKFGGLYDERDPLIGNDSNPQETRRTGTFSVEEDLVRKRFTDVPEFVTVKGGAYFFLPGIKALTFLASI